MAEDQEKSKAKPKVKRPTAKKRDIQAAKRQVENKAFKSRIRTAMRKFDESIVGKDKTAAQTSLHECYSLMDKGVKRGIYKQNKADRTKSRLTAKVPA